MSLLELAVTGGQLVTPSGLLEASIGVRSGKIALLAGPSESVEAHEVIDARGHLVLPGILDAHVHMREPGYGHKEGFETGTMAAAAGGVTTVMIMPTTVPPTVTPAAFEEKVRLAQGRAYVDFAIQAGVGEDFGETEKLAQLGVVSFEVFLADLPPPLGILESERLLKVLELLGSTGVVVGITPGDDGVVRASMARLEREGVAGWKAFTRSRPPLAEAMGIARACLLAAEAEVPIHLRQLSSRQSVEVLRAFKGRAHATAEVTPHHLLLTEETLETQGAFAKMTPPLRTSEDLEALWEALRDRMIETVATDHAPHLPTEKLAAGSDVWKPPGGIPGVQTLLPLMLREVTTGRLALPDLVRVLAEAPARIFGLYPRKGTLQPGADADLVLVDPKRRATIRNEVQLSKAGVTPFEGWEVIGWPVLTMVRGRTVMRDGKIEGPPHGALVTRVASM